jgi:DNA-binding response OmpR family regulator
MQVLIVEDDVMLADCLAEALTDEGHVVCGIAGTVAEAVSLARQHRPDVAVLDMQLRGTECGSEIAEQLAASGDCDGIGILYVTGQSERVQRDAHVGHGYLNKPYNFAALNAALEIVSDVARQGSTKRALPRGFRFLHSVTTDARRTVG